MTCEAMDKLSMNETHSFEKDLETKATIGVGTAGMRLLVAC